MALCPNGGKKIFESERSAKKSRNTLGRFVKLKVYRCPYCHGYHLTHEKTRGRR